MPIVAVPEVRTETIGYNDGSVFINCLLPGDWKTRRQESAIPTDVPHVCDMLFTFGQYDKGEMTEDPFFRNITYGDIMSYGRTVSAISKLRLDFSGISTPEQFHERYDQPAKDLGFEIENAYPPSRGIRICGERDPRYLIIKMLDEEFDGYGSIVAVYRLEDDGIHALESIHRDVAHTERYLRIYHDIFKYAEENALKDILKARQSGNSFLTSL
jgi:hypothetical protein